MANENSIPTAANGSATQSEVQVAATQAAAPLQPVVSPTVEVSSAAPVAPVSNPNVKSDGPYQVVVKAPADKGMLAYLVGPGADIVLKGIDLNSATLTEEGGNLRITTKEGGEILLLDYVNSARDPHTVVTTQDGTLPAQKLLAALEVAEKQADVEPAAGPQVGGSEHGGIEVPAILGTGVGSGEGIFSSVIGPYALPIWGDKIVTQEFPFEPSQENLNNGPTPGNLPPFAHNDRFSTAVNTTLTLNPGKLLVNDTDPENDPLTIISVQGPLHGTVNIVNGNVVFTPEKDFTGTGSFSYTITDGHGNTSTADVLIQIDPTFPGQNTVIAADDAYLVPSGETRVLNVLVNDSDPQGDALVPGSVRILTGPDRGTATVNPADGTISYQADTTNTDYFTTLVYEVRDARGAADTATVTIEVKAGNNVVAVDDTGEIIPAGASKVFNVAANDYDPQGDAFTITRIVSGPTQGTATFNAATGEITYNSVAGSTYTDSITYEITDAKGATDTAVLTIKVSDVNNVSAADDTADMVAGQDVNIKVLRNDYDQQGDSFHITAHTNPVDENGNPRGSVDVNPDGTITFTDAAGARDSGVVEFKYTITDSKGATDDAVVRVTITPAINGVDANNDTITMESSAGRTNITNLLLKNDFDPQGDAFHITSISPLSPNKGMLELVGDQVFFTPDNTQPNPGSGNIFPDNYSLVFNYTITDSKGAEDTAQVLINLRSPTPGDLIAGNDNYNTPYETPITISAASILANDYDPEGYVLKPSDIVNYTKPPHGNLSQDAAGNFIYTPDAGFSGTDSFTYMIHDDQNETAYATVTIRVGDPLSQDNPVDAVDDFLTLAPGETKYINVLSNDSAPDGGLAFVKVIGTLPAGVIDHGNGVFSYHAPDNQTGQTLTFQYQARDVDGDTDIATVTIKVEGPITNTVDAVDDMVATPFQTPVTINVLTNDRDPQGDAFSITGHTNPSHGTVVQNANGTFTYTPANGFTGDDSFTYTITDSKGATDTATVRIHTDEKPYNDVIANDDTAGTAYQTPVTINVRANDYDPQGDAFSITAHTNPSHGSVVQNPNGTFTYTPANGFSGQDSFTYTITDSKGATDTATVTITVNAAPYNDVIATDDTASTAYQTPVTIAVLGNDYDPQGDAFSITGHTNPAHGTVVQNANGTFTYTPANGYSGSDSFTYTITDNKGATDTATVTITVGNAPANTVDAVNDTASTAYQTPVTISVLANDYDPQGDAFTITGHTNPSHGSVVQNANGTFTYTPANGYSGSDSFTYTITDTKGATDTATVTITVGNAPANSVDAVNDTATSIFGNPVVIRVLANDFDPQGDAFTIIGNTNPSHGSVTQNANGTFTYIPTNGYVGTDTFTYTIMDTKGATDTATVTINVTAAPVNNSVDARDDAASTAYQTPVTIAVLSNDIDPQGDTFSITNHSNPSHGSVTQSGSTFIYTPASGFSGTDTFTYTITDSKGASDSATVTVNVGNPPYTPPPVANTVVAVPDSYSTAYQTPFSFNVLGNDYDPQGDAFTLTSLSSASHGAAVQTSNGVFTYFPNAGFTGTDSFTYTITDSRGATSSTTVTINVGAPPQPANSVIANDDSATTTYQTPVTIAVLNNDTDPQGDPFNIYYSEQPSHGTVGWGIPNQTLVYTPANGFIGTDTFRYAVMDSKGAWDFATVTVNVIPGASQGPGTGWQGGDGGDGGGGGDGCPLVIDLDKNGIALTSLAQSNAHFNLNADVDPNSTAVHTAWYGANEGILALDRNGNGTIDSVKEVFGGTGIDGYTVLAREDSNNDGVIDAKDTVFNDLRVWIDANQDGISDPGELFTLQQLGIKAIHIASTDTSVRYEDAYISKVSTVEMVDGTTRDSASVFFTNDGTHSIKGTAANDVIMYNSGATHIDGKGGTNTLRVAEGHADIKVGENVELKNIDAINLHNGSTDSLTINVADVLNIAHNGILTVTGDAVDQVHLTGDYTQGANVQQNGSTFASYSAGNGAQLLIELGVTVHQDPIVHG